MKIEELAHIAHEANLAFKSIIGETNLEHWPLIPESQRNSIINGVKFLIDNPEATVEDSHQNWFDYKKEKGWKFGYEIDFSKKTHPCMLPYSLLPEEQKKKDELFMAIINTFRNQIK